MPIIKGGTLELDLQICSPDLEPLKLSVWLTEKIKDSVALKYDLFDRSLSKISESTS